MRKVLIIFVVHNHRKRYNVYVLVAKQKIQLEHVEGGLECA